MISMTRRLFRTEHDLAREDLSAYLDNELTRKDRARVERHVRACPACRAELEALRRTADLLHLLPEVSLPRSFLVPVAEGRQAVALQRRPAFAAMRLASVMATLLFVVAVSGNLLLQSGLGMRAVLSVPPTAQEAVIVRETVVVEKEVAVERQVEVAQVAAAPQAAFTEEVTAKAMGAADLTPASTGEAEAVALVAPEALLEKEAPRMMAAPEPQAAPQAEMVSRAPEESVTVDANALAAEPTAAVLALKAESPAGAGEQPADASVSAYGVADDGQVERGSAPRGEWLRPVLDGLMWVLLVATVVLWAGTAALSKR